MQLIFKNTSPNTLWKGRTQNQCKRERTICPGPVYVNRELGEKLRGTLKAVRSDTLLFAWCLRGETHSSCTRCSEPRKKSRSSYGCLVPGAFYNTILSCDVILNVTNLTYWHGFQDAVRRFMGRAWSTQNPFNLLPASDTVFTTSLQEEPLVFWTITC